MIAVGVDTHKQQHHAVALDGLGQVLGEIVIATTLAGYSQFMCWLKDLGGDLLVGIEGAGSYGAGLCEFLQAEEIGGFERGNAHNDVSVGAASQIASMLCWPRRSSPVRVSRHPGGPESVWRYKCCWRATAPSSASAPASTTSCKRCRSAHRTRCGNESAKLATARRSLTVSPECAPGQPQPSRRT